MRFIRRAISAIWWVLSMLFEIIFTINCLIVPPIYIILIVTDAGRIPLRVHFFGALFTFFLFIRLKDWWEKTASWREKLAMEAAGRDAMVPIRCGACGYSDHKSAFSGSRCPKCGSLEDGTNNVKAEKTVIVNQQTGCGCLGTIFLVIVVIVALKMLQFI